MAITRAGLTGPLTAYGVFAAKAASAAAVIVLASTQVTATAPGTSGSGDEVTVITTSVYQTKRVGLQQIIIDPFDVDNPLSSVAGLRVGDQVVVRNPGVGALQNWVNITYDATLLQNDPVQILEGFSSPGLPGWFFTVIGRGITFFDATSQNFGTHFLARITIDGEQPEVVVGTYVRDVSAIGTVE